MDQILGITNKFHLHWKNVISVCTITVLQILHGGLSCDAIANQNCSNFCGSIPLLHPFGRQEGCGAFPYREMLQCDGEKLRLRTASGPFEVRTVDYESQTMTIWDPSMSTCASVNPISDRHFSPDPVLRPSNNTILLLDCASTSLVTLRSSEFCNKDSPFDCKDFHGCHAFREGLGRERVRSSSPPSCCSTDFHTLGKHSLKELQCSHYSSVYGAPSGREKSPNEWSYGIRLSFDFLDHAPNIRLCGECDKPDGYCGIGLRCICRPHECENQILSTSTSKFASQKMINIMLLWSLLTGLGLWNIS